MNSILTSVGDLKTYHEEQLKAARLRAVGWELAAMILFGMLAYFSKQTVLYVIGFLVAGIIALLHRKQYKKAYARIAVFKRDCPESWKEILRNIQYFIKVWMTRNGLCSKNVYSCFYWKKESKVLILRLTMRCGFWLLPALLSLLLHFRLLTTPN